MHRAGNSTTPWQRLALAAGAALATLLVFEAAARVWVAVRWPEAKAFALTHATATRGRYTSHPGVGYVLAPGYRSEKSDAAGHDSRGLRLGLGGERPVDRAPGVARVAVLGASTVYGIYVRDEQTSSAQLEAALGEAGITAEVFNAGVPGWTSRETLLSWRERVGALSPDVAVVIDGRNDAFAQLWNGYRDDYGHYRDPSYELRTSNLAFKRVFRFSHLAMTIVTRGSLFGFSQLAEHPLYGAIDYAAKPTPEQARAAARDASRANGFEHNLRTLAAELEGDGIALALATIPFRPEGFASGVFKDRDAYVDAIALRVRANNAMVRDLARELGVPLIDLESLSREELLHDDCHFNEEGEREAGRMMRDVLAPRLRASGYGLVAAAQPFGRAGQGSGVDFREHGPVVRKRMGRMHGAGCG